MALKVNTLSFTHIVWFTQTQKSWIVLPRWFMKLPQLQLMVIN